MGKRAAGFGALGGVWSDLARENAFHITATPAILSRQKRLAVIGDLNLPQCRKYRVEQLIELWGHDGIDVRFAHYQDVSRATSILQDASHLLIYRVLRSDLGSTYLYEARRLRVPIAFDIDDPLFSVPAYETYQNMNVLPVHLKSHFLKQAPLYHDMMNAADVLSLSTPGLRDEAARFVPRPAFVRRNFADKGSLAAGASAHAASVAEKEGGSDFTLVFASGSQGHEADFQLIAEEVEAFLAAAPNRKLMVVGHFRSELFSDELADQIELVPFADYTAYLQALAKADCAIMPLANDLFNQCKSGVRVIDAASVSLPSIVSNVGDLPNLIVPGETGMVASTAAEWRDALEHMASDRRQTAEMGLKARRNLETTWSGKLAHPIIEQGLIDWVKG